MSGRSIFPPNRDKSRYLTKSGSTRSQRTSSIEVCILADRFRIAGEASFRAAEPTSGDAVGENRLFS